MVHKPAAHKSLAILGTVGHQLQRFALGDAGLPESLEGWHSGTSAPLARRAFMSSLLLLPTWLPGSACTA